MRRSLQHRWQLSESIRIWTAACNLRSRGNGERGSNKYSVATPDSSQTRCQHCRTFCVIDISRSTCPSRRGFVLM